jgi:hypothetical protein
MSACSDSDIESLGCEWVLILQSLKQVLPDSDEGVEDLIIELSKVICLKAFGNLSLLTAR